MSGLLEQKQANIVTVFYQEFPTNVKMVEVAIGEV